MKKFLFCIFLMIAGAALFAQEAEDEAPPEIINAEDTADKVYAVGDIGPAGGTIFFDRGFKGDGWRYLEAAPAGAEFQAQWGSYRSNVTNTMPGVGFGKENTRLIVDRLAGLREVNRAAQLCAEMDINGYKDWFMPSKDELNLMFRNLKRAGIGGFANDWYWSSTERSRDFGWNQKFILGNQDGNHKDRVGRVRAVRAF
jgi:hypothetical protein